MVSAVIFAIPIADRGYILFMGLPGECPDIPQPYSERSQVAGKWLKTGYYGARAAFQNMCRDIKKTTSIPKYFGTLFIWMFAACLIYFSNSLDIEVG
jgi:hypothetical protein